jgi:hypothetical protein
MLLLSACATTQVPQVNAAQLHHPKLSAKALRVEVRDTRTPPADDNGKTIDVVRDAIVKVLTDSGVNVTNEGREVLSVGVGYFDHPPAGFDRESCVELAGRLVVGSGPVETRSFGCYGSSKGVNEAFATALNTLFDELEKRSADAAAKAAPPSAPPK